MPSITGYRIFEADNLRVLAFTVLVAAIFWTVVTHHPLPEAVLSSELQNQTNARIEGTPIWRQYYLWAAIYLTKTKYTVGKSILDLPNTKLFTTAFPSLSEELKCDEITKQALSGKEVFKCSSQHNGNYYIKIPRDSLLINLSFIKEVIGSLFYSRFLNFTVDQYLYEKGDRALISREVEGFIPFSTYFRHSLIFDKNLTVFNDALLFNNSFCLDSSELDNLGSSLFEIGFGRQVSLWDNLKYFVSRGVRSVSYLCFRLLFQFNLNLSFLWKGHLPSHNDFCPDFKNTSISGLPEMFLTSFLLYNEDLNFRNLGFINMSTHLKVITIDYDQIGSGWFSGDTKSDLKKHLELSRLLLWKPHSPELITAAKSLLGKLPQINKTELHDSLKRKLPQIEDEEIIDVLQNVFKYRPKASSEQNRTLPDHVEFVVGDVLPRRLKVLIKFFENNPNGLSSF